MTRRRCPACKGYFLLNGGTARCPHCGRVVSATARTGASSMRASDLKRWRFLGQHGGQRRGRPQTPFVVRGQQPDPQALAKKKAYHQALAEKRAYWRAEYAEIEAEFGPLGAGAQELLCYGKR